MRWIIIAAIVTEGHDERSKLLLALLAPGSLHAVDDRARAVHVPVAAAGSAAAGAEHRAANRAHVRLLRCLPCGCEEPARVSCGGRACRLRRGAHMARGI